MNIIFFKEPCNKFWHTTFVCTINGKKLLVEVNNDIASDEEKLEDVLHSAVCERISVSVAED